MNKKKALILGGIGVVIVMTIIGLSLVFICSGGNDNKKEKATETTTSIDNANEIEKDTEDTSEENTTDKETIGEDIIEYEPTESQLACREVLKNQIFEFGYDKYQEGYLHLLYVYFNAYRNNECKFSLIDYDGDEVLELVAKVNNSITMYTYKDGNAYKLIDNWEYGAGGNHGYEYASGKGVVRNYNTDYAGLIIYETYIFLSVEDGEVVEDRYYLKQTFFDDANNNGVPDEDEAIGDEYVRCYIGENEVTSAEYSKAMVIAHFENLTGKTGISDFTRALEKPELVRMSDKKCKEAYLKTIEEFEQNTEEDMSRSYALIDFDGDDILELVCQRGGHRISLYTYEDGQVYQLADDWSWGAGANHGYEYMPGKNVLRNRDTDSGIAYTLYERINDNNELESMYYIAEEFGEEGEVEKYFKCIPKHKEEEITEDEYKELEVDGFFYMIEGWYKREEIEAYLK